MPCLRWLHGHNLQAEWPNRRQIHGVASRVLRCSATCPRYYSMLENLSSTLASYLRNRRYGPREYRANAAAGVCGADGACTVSIVPVLRICEVVHAIVLLCVLAAASRCDASLLPVTPLDRCRDVCVPVAVHNRLQTLLQRCVSFA